MQDLAVALVDCEMQTESASRRKSSAKFAKLAKFGKIRRAGWRWRRRRCSQAGWCRVEGYKGYTRFTRNLDSIARPEGQNQIYRDDRALVSGQFQDQKLKSKSNDVKCITGGLVTCFDMLIQATSHTSCQDVDESDGESADESDSEADEGDLDDLQPMSPMSPVLRDPISDSETQTDVEPLLQFLSYCLVT